ATRMMNEPATSKPRRVSRAKPRSQPRLSEAGRAGGGACGGLSVGFLSFSMVSGPPCRPELGAARARVAPDFFVVRRHRLLCQRLPRSFAPEGLLAQPVFQRVKADNPDPSSGPHEPRQLGQQSLQRAK